MFVYGCGWQRVRVRVVNVGWSNTDAQQVWKFKGHYLAPNSMNQTNFEIGRTGKFEPSSFHRSKRSPSPFRICAPSNLLLNCCSPCKEVQGNFDCSCIYVAKTAWLGRRGHPTASLIVQIIKPALIPHSFSCIVARGGDNKIILPLDIGFANVH